MVKNASPILEALRIATINETAAVEFFEQHRWPNGIACPRCGSVNVYKMTGKDGARNKDHRLRCRDCAVTKMFTVRTGTVLEETRLPVRVWAFAFWRAAASKKGIAALELAREMEITHKSALFVLRRIRHGISITDAPKFTGTIEADETYVGGKRKGTKRGRPNVAESHKTPVFGVVERGGNVRLRMMERLTANRLGDALAEVAETSCRLITDDMPSYRRPGKAFTGGHEIVTHSEGEYVRKGTDVHSNTIEGVFSLIKRGVMGIFHSVSRKHLPNYLNEYEFRWNTRFDNDGDRISKSIRQMEGKRLMYRESVDNPPYQPDFSDPQASAPFEDAEPIF